MHLMLQKMDLQNEYDKDKIIELKNKLVMSKIITENEANAIDINKILNFTKTEFAKKIANAKAVFKEKPFYININASELLNEEVDEKILVQGIIDLYYIDENDNVVLVDYKTDYVKEGKELVEKYRKQLEIYKKALEIALNKKVEKVYIYSLWLNQEILVD